MPPPDDASSHGPLRVIAIDGPVASGKTAVGRRLAERLGWRFLDTGIMYRAVTWCAQEEETDFRDAVALAQIARRPITIESVDGAVAGGNGPAVGLRIRVDGVDATPHLREHSVEATVSIVAAVPDVRRALVAQQRALARRAPYVMVGRDIGTVVLPDAAVKIFLTASPEERARRRAAEMRAAGRDVTDQQVLDELRRRDRLDREREASPLRAADDAIPLDTTDRSLEQAVEAALRIVRERLPEAAPP